MAKAKEKTVEIVPVEMISDLSTLAPITMNVEIEWHDGNVIAIPLKTLSYGRYVALGREIPDPIPQSFGGANGVVVYDFKDPDYVRRLNEADERRAFRRLLAALTLPVPGDTVDAQMDWLRDEMDGRVTRTLIQELNKAFAVKLGSAESRAANFQGGGREGAASGSAGEQDAE